MAKQDKSKESRKSRKSRGSRQYSIQDLTEAIEKVKSGQMSCYAAAIDKQIPRSTLQNHLNGTVSVF